MADWRSLPRMEPSTRSTGMAIMAIMSSSTSNMILNWEKISTCGGACNYGVGLEQYQDLQDCKTSRIRCSQDIGCTVDLTADPAEHMCPACTGAAKAHAAPVSGSA